MFNEKNFKKLEVKQAHDFPAAFENSHGMCPKVESSHHVLQKHSADRTARAPRSLMTVQAQLPLELRGSNPSTPSAKQGLAGPPGHMDAEAL